MSEPVHLVSETLKYSDGSEKVVTFNLHEEIKEDEIDAQLAKIEEFKAPVDGNGNPIDPFAKEAEEAPSDETEK
jgi:hypothetical protein